MQMQSSTENVISAKEALMLSASKWKNLSNEKIFDKIQLEARNGYRMAEYFDAYITQEQQKYLEELGYKVYIRKRDGSAPYFYVSW